MLRSLNQERIKGATLLLPKLSEQQAIANYLDLETGRIDTLIAKKEKLIELLREKRTALITQTVTKGLNPNTKTKDTGIPWLGAIPEHWDVKRLQFIAHENKVKNNQEQERNLLSLSYGNIVKKDYDTDEGLLPANFKGYQVVEKGNVILRLTDLQNDKKSLRAGLVNNRGIITSAYLGLIANDSILSQYLYNYLHTADIHKVFYGMGSGLRQSLRYDEFKSLYVIIPPKPEQKAIADYLDTETQKIDKTIDKITQLIEKLKEYHISIITHAVTGKIKVL